jgi:hypothetical protein
MWERGQRQRVFHVVWPEYNAHGLHAARYLGALVPRHAHLQALFLDRRSDELVARARTIPFHWDGTLDDLPSGIDALGLRALNDDRVPNTLSALAAEILPQYQGQGLSSLVIATMVWMAGRARLAPLVAPVRPNWKERHPQVAIEEYASWKREDGLPYDPWMRVHVRLGARILRAEPRSMEFVAPVSDWERWTGTRFPGSGSHLFPQCLAPLAVADDIGAYWEPNVWMLHQV